MSMNFNFDELNNLDMSDMGSWPVAAKALVVAVLVLMIAFRFHDVCWIKVG